MQYDLSIIIPSRSEMFLARTIEDILKNIEANTEVIAVLDGEWSNPPIPQHERVNVIYTPEAIGQRAATNLGVKLSKATYVMKLDAHCSFDKGFDRKMIEGFKKVGNNVTMVPVMRNLWAFDWKCYHCGWKQYQGPTPDKCGQCGKTDKIRRKMMWVGKRRPQSVSYCFDPEPHFQYFEDWKHREPFITDKKTGFTETMSLQGSCFMATRKNYWELNLCDEKLGSWGNQGIELSVKTRLSGGNVLVNHNTWYAHMFRTQGGDFGFPYDQSGREVAKCKMRVRDLFFNNKWDKQIYPLSKAVEPFLPVPGWTDEEYNKLKKKEMEVKRPGIYSIKNKKTNNVYIGSAKNLAQRFGEHLRMLDRNDHDNKFLQRSWNKYGKDNFSFNIEYFCEKEDLISNEQKFIDKHKKKIGWRNMYNLNPLAKSRLGIKHTKKSLMKMRRQQSGKGNGFYGKKHSLESIKKMKEAHKGCPSWNKGIHWSDKIKEKISKAKIGGKAWNKGLTKETDARVRKGANKLVGRKLTFKPLGMLGKKHSKATKDKIAQASIIIAERRERNEKGQFVLCS